MKVGDPFCFAWANYLYRIQKLNQFCLLSKARALRGTEHETIQLKMDELQLSG